MRVLVTGSTGLVGSALLDSLRQQHKHDLARLVRPSTRNPVSGRDRSLEPASLAWDPVAGHLDPAASGADAVVHLAGASIGKGRWTAARKRLLCDSRIAATRQLVDALGQLPKPPQIFIAASAIGFYGDRGDEELTESSSSGQDFLAGLCRDWEAESLRAASFGARVVLPRFGIILSTQGGALPRMLTPFRMGVGGRLGSGQQWMSWVALDDVIGILQYALETPALAGPVNVVAPNPVRNSEFTAVLGRVLHRPTLFPAPAFMLKLALGEMAEALLFSSHRVLPQALYASRYTFSYQLLEPSLRNILAR